MRVNQPSVPNNPTWFAFVAWCEELELLVEIDNCTSVCNDGSPCGTGPFPCWPSFGGCTNGAQIAIYANCDFTEQVACNAGDCGNENDKNLSMSGLEIGQIYYFVIDGCAGSACDVIINVVGVCGSPEIEDWTNPIDGEEIACLDDPQTYIVDNLEGANTYHWFVDGDEIATTDDPEYTIDWTEEGIFELCVDASNEPCIPLAGNENPICMTIEVIDPNAGELVIDPNPLCPGETADISVMDYNDNPDLGLAIIITDLDLEVVEVQIGDQTTFSHPECEVFIVYAYQFAISLIDELPEVGDFFLPPDCEVDCCDILQEELSFEDNEPPEFLTPPDDQTVACFTLIPEMQDLEFEDDCMDPGTVAGVEEEDLNGCQGGTISRTWTVEDSCGNIAEHTQIITVEPFPETEFVDPPGDETVDCNNIPSSFPDLEFTNNADEMECEIAGIAEPMVEDNVENCEGTIVVTWEFVDSCGETIQHIQTIEVIPPELPEFIDPPGNITVDCEDSPGSTPPLLDYTNNQSDLCEISGEVEAVVSGSADICGGLIEYNWEFTDDCNRTIDHQQQIEVLPATEASFLDPPESLNLTCADLPLDDPIDLEYTNGIMGDCGIEGMVSPIIQGSADQCGGEITYIWEFTDDCGRTTTHIQTISVEPLPEAEFIDAPQNMTIDCNGLPIDAPDLNYTNGEVGDCEISGSVSPQIDGNADFCGGEITLTWEFTDDCGRTTTHSQIITVEPNPQAEFIDAPQNITIDCSGLPIDAPDLNYTNGEVGDCEISGTVSPQIDGNADFCGGEVTLTWEFTDDCGRTTTHSQIITVEPTPDAEFVNPPQNTTVTCNNIPTSAPDLEYTNSLTGDCEISGTVSPVESGSADLCGGEIIYTWEFTDDCGRLISYSQTITVVPIEEAEFDDLPEDLLVDCGNVPGDLLTLNYSNGQSGDCLIEGEVMAVRTGTVDNCGGILTDTWTVSDPCGRQINHSRTIEVTPAPMPDFINPPADIDLSCSESVSDPEILFFTNGEQGDCLIEGQVEAVVDGQASVCGGDISYTWEWVDDCGRTLSYTQIISQEPADLPVFIDPPEDLVLDCEEVTFDPPNLSFTNNANQTECLLEGSVSPTSINSFDYCGGQLVHVWEHTDPCGRTIEYQQVIDVEPAPQADFTNPPEDITVSCDNIPSSDEFIMLTNGLDGQCEVLVEVLPEQVGSYDGCGGEIILIYSFTDNCFRTTEYIQSVTVEPSIPPEFVDPPADTTVSCENADALFNNPPELFYSNGLDGDCEVSGTVIPEVVSLWDECGGDISFIWEAEICGIELQHVQIITVEAAPGAEFINPPEDGSLNCGEPIPDPFPLAYDNGLSASCAINGNVDPEIEQIGEMVTFSWTFEGNCGEIIEHVWTIETQPIPDIAVEPTGASLCEGGSFDLGNLEISDMNNTDPEISFHTESPANADNILNNLEVNPTETTTYYILASNGVDCNEEVEFTITVNQEQSAGMDASDQFCFGTTEVNFWPYLGMDFDPGGQWIDLDNSGADISNPENVDVSSVDAGNYNFLYAFAGEGACEGDTAQLSVEFFPEINIDILAVTCNEENTAYQVTGLSNGYIITASQGIVNELPNDTFVVTEIEIDTEITITASISGSDCENTFSIGAPNCDCPNVPPPISGGNPTICEGDEIPVLTVTLSDPETIAHWYDSPTGGNLLDSDTLEFAPDVSEPGTYQFYVATESIDFPDCFSSVRTAITLTISAPPSAQDAMLETCDIDNAGTGVFELNQAIPQISGNPNFTFSFHLTEEDAINDTDSLDLTYTNIQANEQTVYVRVENPIGCISIVELTLMTYPVIELNVQTIRESCLESADGSATLTAVGGIGNLEYSLNGEDWLEDNEFDNLEAGNYTAYVRDEEGCIFETDFELDPGKQLEIMDFTPICRDAGTPTQPDDDFYDIEFVLTHNYGNSGNFDVFVNGDSTGRFEYGLPGELTFAANGQSYLLLFVDVENGCEISVETGPLNPCSSDCSIDLTAIDQSCQDNGTPSDPTDDFYIISLLAEAINPGDNNAYEVILNGVAIDTFSYGSEGTFTLPVDGSSLELILMDLDETACELTVQLQDLEPCSDDCLIEAVVDSIVCNSQGTPDDPLDDTFVAYVTVSGVNNSDEWLVVGNPGERFSYNESVELGPWLIADGSFSLVLVDSEDPSCTFEISINPPPPCSSPCIIEAVNLTIGECNDNGTGTISEDDFFGVSFTVNSVDGRTTQYIVEVSGMTHGPFDYGEEIFIDSLNANGEDIVLFITDEGNPSCQTSFIVGVESCSSCDQEISAGEDKVLSCEVGIVTLDGTATEDGDFLWSGPGGFTSTDSQPMVNEEGVYQLTVTFEDLCEFTDEVEVTFDGDLPEVDAGDNQTLSCGTSEVTLEGSVSGNPNDFTFQWFFEDNPTILSENITAEVGEAGVYTLEVTDLSNGCTNTDEVEVLRDTNDIENLELTIQNPLCPGSDDGQIEVTSVDGGTPPFAISLNGSFSEDGVFTQLSAGNYTITVTDSLSCLFEENVALSEAEPILVDLGPDLFLDQGSEALITAEVSIPIDQIDQIIWAVDGEVACNPCEELEFLFTGEESAVVEITVVDSNGCVGTDQILINFIIDRNVYVPNAFSPNGDGVNDQFVIYGSENIEEIEVLRVFDRWGSKVFETGNVPVNEAQYGWDGTYRSEKLNPAVFIYYVRVRFTDNSTLELSGDLLLVD